MSHVGSSGHQVTSILRDVPGQSWDIPHGIVRSLMGLSGHQVTSSWKDVPGQSWDIPHGIIQTSSHFSWDVPGQSWDVPHRIRQTSCHPSLQGCPRTVLGCLISKIVLRCPGHLKATLDMTATLSLLMSILNLKVVVSMQLCTQN